MPALTPRRAGRAGWSPWLALLAALLVATLAGPARAGLFDDEEARKAILDLRARIQAADDASKARTAELAASQAQLIDQLRRSLLDLNASIETQRAEIAKLRGAQEQLARDLAEVQRWQKDAVQGVDDRLRKLEPVAVQLDGKDFVATPEEKRAHDAAMALLRSGDFERAATALSAFLQRYPSSGYSISVRYWLGNAQYGKKDYREAINNFRMVLTMAPDHPRAPEALLATANSQIEMKDVKAARKSLDDLLKAYPQSEAATAAKDRLASLKG